jgi:cob(I)alamin adenosyltransferase
MTIYTRTGDSGEASLLGGVRVVKDTARLEAVGTLDELDAWLGLVRCEPLPEGVNALLERLQRRMVGLRASLATVPPAKPSAPITLQEVQSVEHAIDRYDAALVPLRNFIVPAGSRAAGMLHVARTVCRRAERHLVSLARAEPEAVAPPLMAYVNRLSDLLFVLARAANAQAGIGDAPC